MIDQFRMPNVLCGAVVVWAGTTDRMTAVGVLATTQHAIICAALKSDRDLSKVRRCFLLFNLFDSSLKCFHFKYGEVEEINVCENIGEHMVGNVYVKFVREEDADRACRDLNDNRW